MSRFLLFATILLFGLSPVDATAQDAHATAPVRIVAPADSIWVVVDSASTDPHRLGADELLRLEPGEHELLVGARGYIDRRVVVDVPEGEGTFQVQADLVPAEARFGDEGLLRVSSVPVFECECNLIVDAPQNVRLEIDGRPVDAGSYRLPPGEHTLRAKFGAALEKVWTLDIQGYPPRARYIYADPRPEAATTRTLAFVPGMAAFQKQQPLRTMTYLGGTAVLTLGTVASFVRHQVLLDQYDKDTRALYGAESREAAQAAEQDAIATYDKLKSSRTITQTLAIGAGVIYLVNVLDGLRTPDGGWRGDAPGLQLSSRGAGITLTF